MTGATRKQKDNFFSLLKCIQKSNVIKKIIWVLVFSICIWYLAYPTDRSLRAEEKQVFSSLEERMKVDNACLTTDIYIQLNGPNKVRLVNYMAQYVNLKFWWYFCL